MSSGLSHTEKEMLEAGEVCQNFDFNITKELAERIGTDRIIFTGMGSSMIFPAKQAKNRALKFNIVNKVEAYFASDLFQYTDFSNTYLFLCSNSGKTKEVILLLEYAKKRGATCIAVTAVSDSILAKRCDTKIILSCGFEKGIAATKSVVEQGLIYDSLIFHLAKNQGKNVNLDQLKKDVRETGEKVVQNVNQQINKKILKKLASANHLFFVGLETGVAEEITLKTYEITRKLALFYPDTHIVHGVEEAIDGDVAIIFEPMQFEQYLSDFRAFSKRTNCMLFGIDQNPSIPGLDVAVNDTFKNYCFLSAGWGLLRNVANYNKIDIDHPEKASKVGNPYN